MPPKTVTDRLRVKLFELFRHREFSKSGLARYCKKPPSWVSNFLHPSVTRTLNPSFHLDDLEDIAGYFRASIGEMLGAAKPRDLTGDEQRMVYAFRALPAEVREHFLALIEQASAGPPRLGGVPSRQKD